ncbi:GntR family transcriptional regulator [Brucella gallinifaecis]|uniref:GntR family transcriptional regulator n=1 Tax=Brucella gallinifaecis TaxID=215590 RepID=A0A502BSJ4_9HYPH|nr:GntR family transcriptional regulator [Brucella gallinifaecis]
MNAYATNERRSGARSGRRSTPRSQAIFESLERDLILGILRPNSTLLELDLADHFGCSQSTVREALLQLQEQGLVERTPHRGTNVADCRIEDARVLLKIRRDIECSSIDRILKRYDTRVRQALVAEIEHMLRAAKDNDEYMLSMHDRQFHLTLFNTAQLPSVVPILTRCLIHNHRFKIMNSQPNRALLETAERHFPILESLDKGDPKALYSVLSHHIATIVDFGADFLANRDDQQA